MLAFSWRRSADSGLARVDGERLASSLCAGIGGFAGSASCHGAAFAYRRIGNIAAQARTWKPGIASDGTAVAFHGHIANAVDIAAALRCPTGDPGTLYGAAVATWGDDADRRLIGDYCAIVFDPAEARVRLSRSPLRAPPLHYAVSAHHIAAASVPRAIFACGFDRVLDDRRIADSAWFNFSDESASWYRGLARVPLGAIVEVHWDDARTRRYYDIMALPEVRLATDADYIARAGELLDEGVRAALAGARAPGATLSGGLDSPQVSVRALRALPPERTLPTFTFVPEPGWDGVVPDGMVGDEEAMVRAFAALHPRLEPHFTQNVGIAHDYRWAELFHLMGTAPSGMCNMYVFHGLFEAARQRGCDRLLLAEWGNFTFSDKGDWGFVEYLLGGRWRQLWRALRDHPNDRRSLLRKFIALSAVPLLPDPAWRAMMRLWHPGERDPSELISPLNGDFRRRWNVVGRARASRVSFDRYQPRSRLDARRKLFSNADAESADLYQGFEQLYGIELRDPTAYRPFVEFCLGLPTHLFLRDGTLRWLAKEMARGIMPEDQRANLRNGRWDADWHLRISRRRGDWLAELDRAARNPRLAAILDIPRLKQALEDFPEGTVIDRQHWMPVELGVPRGLLTARFVEWVEGRNAP